MQQRDIKQPNKFTHSLPFYFNPVLFRSSASDNVYNRFSKYAPGPF